MEFLPVAHPQSAAELAVMISLLEAHEIHFYVHNQGFGSLYPCMPVHLFNDQRIMVKADQADDAFRLLSVLQTPATDSPGQHQRILGWRDRLRVLAELLLMGHWCFPVPWRTFDTAPDDVADESPTPDQKQPSS